jgi:hypothetical protein
MATIDPSIALSIKPIQIQDPLNRMASMMQIESGQQSQQLNALQMRKAQQEFDTQNRLGKAWQGSINPDTGEIDYNSLLRNLSQDEIGATAIPGVIKQRKDADLAAQQLKTQQLQADSMGRSVIGGRGMAQVLGRMAPVADVIGKSFGIIGDIAGGLMQYGNYKNIADALKK